LNIEMIEGKQSLLINFETMFDRYEVELQKRKSGIHNYPTGDSYLDQYLTLGFAPGYMSSILADSGVGKSIFALNLINRQINKGIPCLYISPENDLLITMDRLAAMRLDINYDEFYFKKESNLNKDLFEMLHEEKERIKKIKSFHFVEETNLSLDDINIIGKEAKKRMDSDYLVIVNDLLSMVTEFAINIDPQSIEEHMNTLHRIAKQGNYHFLNVLQANGEAVNFKPKSVKDCEKFRFTNIGNIKNARAWGERSRVVLGMFRPKMIAENIFGEEHPEVKMLDNILFCQILKQNQGPLGLLKYLFIPEKFQLYKYKEK
jgi:KaiC/GvpD/RAD55 family RecA-like ATPase